MIRNVIDSALFFVYHDVMRPVKLQTGGTLEEAMAARGQDHGVGVSKGMKVPGKPPAWPRMPSQARQQPGPTTDGSPGFDAAPA